MAIVTNTSNTVVAKYETGLIEGRLIAKSL